VAGRGVGRLPIAAPAPDERPKAPWHPFPLVELCVLAGIVLLILGLIKFDSRQGKTMLLVGLALGSLGGLDTAAREHFSGYRSHTMVLSGVPAVAVAAVLYFAQLPWPVVTFGAIATFGGAFLMLSRRYH
jgi:hypothetical protein